MEDKDEVIIRIPRAELPVFFAALQEGRNLCSDRGCDDLEFAQIVPDLATRQAMMERYHEWNGDLEVWVADLKQGGMFAEARYWSYSSALFYLQQRIETSAEEPKNG